MVALAATSGAVRAVTHRTTAMRLESPALRPVLAEAARSSDPLSRAWAARGLGALKDASDIPAVTALLADKDEGVVVNALRAAALLGSESLRPAVAAHLSSPSSTLRLEALRALAVLPPDPALRERIVAEIGSPEPAIRAAALAAVAKVDREDFALVLSGLDPDPDPGVRAALAAVLADQGDDASLRILEGFEPFDQTVPIITIYDGKSLALRGDELD